MANHKAAIKSIRQDKKRTAANQARKSRVRTFIKKVEEAVTAKNQKAAEEALRVAQSEIMKAAGKKVLKKGNAARKISRLSAKIKAIKAA